MLQNVMKNRVNINNTCTATLPEWLADVTKLANIADTSVQWLSSKDQIINSQGMTVLKILYHQTFSWGKEMTYRM
jgi:hypothetical protein